MIVLHVCCAPDLAYFLKRLKEDFKEKIVAFFYDPNIHPYEEYKLRLLEAKRICREEGVELYEGEYDYQNWYLKTKELSKEPERGKRCSLCFDLRLLRSFQFAKEVGANKLTTTLLMSPKKDINQIYKEAKKYEEEFKIKFLLLDYRKGGGTQEMFKISRERQIYRQDYCGCLFGLFNQPNKDHTLELTSYLGEYLPGSKEELIRFKELRLWAEENQIEAFEEEFPFLNWRLELALLKVEDKVIPSKVVPYSMPIRGTLKTKPKEVGKDYIIYEKGFLKVIFSQEEPRKFIRFPYSHPTFIVSPKYYEFMKDKKVLAKLQTKVFYSKGIKLYLGKGKEEVPLRVYRAKEEEIIKLLREGKRVVILPNLFTP